MLLLLVEVHYTKRRHVGVAVDKISQSAAQLLKPVVYI